MKQASEKLKAWMVENGIKKQYALGHDLGVDRATACRLLAGKHKPSLDLAVRIETLTGIPPREWVG